MCISGFPDTLFGPLLAARTPGRDAGRDLGEKCGLDRDVSRPMQDAPDIDVRFPLHIEDRIRKPSDRLRSAGREYPAHAHGGESRSPAVRRSAGGRLPARRQSPAQPPVPPPPPTDSARSPHRYRAAPAREGRPACRSPPAGFADPISELVKVVRIGRGRLRRCRPFEKQAAQALPILILANQFADG